MDASAASPPPLSAPAQQPIGVFDSGIGGLSVLRAIWQLLPDEDTLYLADQAHVPYGPRTLEEVQQFSEAVTRWLIGQGAKLIVVACNAASAAALYHLRRIFRTVPFVGMEPAVKPAAEETRTGVVGVLATPATFQGALYASVVERFGNGVTLLPHTCPGLVAQIESGAVNAAQTRAILSQVLQPMLAQGIDTVVLGCTHYSFVIPLIQSITGARVRVIDPAPAVARQVRRLLEARGLRRLPGAAQRSSLRRYYTTGDSEKMAARLAQLLDQTSRVESLQWNAGQLQP